MFHLQIIWNAVYVGEPEEGLSCVTRNLHNSAFTSSFVPSKSVISSIKPLSNKSFGKKPSVKEMSFEIYKYST